VASRLCAGDGGGKRTKGRRAPSANASQPTNKGRQRPCAVRGVAATTIPPRLSDTPIVMIPRITKNLAVVEGDAKALRVRRGF